MKLKNGDSVLYVPIHANGDTNHPDCESGIVDRQEGDITYVRFYRRGIGLNPTGQCVKNENLVLSKMMPDSDLPSLNSYDPTKGLEEIK